MKGYFLWLEKHASVKATIEEGMSGVSKGNQRLNIENPFQDLISIFVGQ